MHWCHWWHHWHHVMLTPMPMVSHGQKSHVAPLIVISGPKKCNAVIDNAIGAVWCWHQCQWHHMTKKNDVAPHFNQIDLRNVVVPWQYMIPVPMVSHDQKSDVAPIFQLSCSIYDATTIMQCQCQCKCCPMTKNVMMQFISVVLA